MLAGCLWSIVLYIFSLETTTIKHGGNRQYFHLIRASAHISLASVSLHPIANMRTTTVATSLLLLGTALAVPEVQVVPRFPGRCTAYPSINLGPGPDRALPFQIIADQADDPAANLLTLYPHDTQLNGEAITYLGVNRCRDCAAANTILRCRDALVTTYQSVTPYIRISKDANNALPWSGDGYTAGIYRHVIDGVDQGHNYWGAQNRTTWGFKVADDGAPEHYKIKLIGLPEDPSSPTTEAQWEPDFLGFVRVIEPFTP